MAALPTLWFRGPISRESNALGDRPPPGPNPCRGAHHSSGIIFVARFWQLHRAVMMRVVCPWCRRESKSDYVREKAPFDNPDSTDGICARHFEQLLESLPSRSFPDVEVLFVVRLEETALYEYLQATLRGVPNVKLIMERRRGDRRERNRAVAAERRGLERRVRSGKRFDVLGYTAFRFGRWPKARDEDSHPH